MCWSFQSSTIFAIVEAILISLIVIRAVRSERENVRQQLWIVPMMISVFAVEIIEALLWSRPEELLLMTDAESQHCSARNKRLTLIVWLCIIPFQPFFVTYCCRRSGDARNWSLFYIPERLSLMFAASMVASYLYTITSPSTPLRTLVDTNYMSYMNEETCSYIGKGGRHIHWTVAQPDSYLVPNAFTYCLLWASCAFARPIRLFSGILLFGISLFVLFLSIFHGGFEAGSVWCWSAIILMFYLLLQPYLLPIDDEKQKHLAI